MNVTEASLFGLSVQFVASFIFACFQDSWRMELSAGHTHYCIVEETVEK